MTSTSQPRLLHPLMGSDLKTLSQLLIRNGSIPLAHWPHVGIMVSAALLRWPFSTFERWWVQHQLPQKPPMPAPIFIVGHWRSGTTFLYNILSRSSQFNYISPLATGLPWDFLILASFLKPLLEQALPQQRFIDRVPVNPDSPQEDEIGLANMQTLSFYHGLYFPKNFDQHFKSGIFLEDCDAATIDHWQQTIHHYFQKHHLQHPHRQLLIKNPVYTARVARLKSMWPEAKFIHIYRNPYVVFQSMRNFYQSLFRELALQPFDHIDIDQVILTTYPKMMLTLIQDQATLAPDQFVEIKFEDLEADPMANITKIYQTLALPDLESAQPQFQSYLEAQGTYRKNQYTFKPEDQALVQKHWQPFLERWGY